MMWDGLDGGMGGLGWLWMLPGVVFMLGLVVLVVLATIWLLRALSDRGPQHPSSARPAAMAASPREVLDLRYARGEMNRDEYQQARHDLEPEGSLSG